MSPALAGSFFTTEPPTKPTKEIRYSVKMVAGSRDFPGPQMVKCLSTMWEIWVRSLGWEDPMEEGMATHSSILAWRIPRNREAWRAESDTTEQLSTAQHITTTVC